LRWQIRDVRPGTGFIIDVPLDGAVLSFEWLFDALSEQRTRITQRIVVAGDNAALYVNQVQAGFGSNLPDGMKRIADAMVRASAAGVRPIVLSACDSPREGTRSHHVARGRAIRAARRRASVTETLR